MRLLLKLLEEKNVTDQYVAWFANKEVARFSDNQYEKITFDGQKSYVRRCCESNDVDLYGVFDEGKHIGNISISGLLSFHKRAEISYVIGETTYWGQGVGAFVVAEIIDKAKNQYKLNKLYAGLADDNVGSKRVLEKNGFKLEGVRRRHLQYNNRFYDQLDYGLIL